MVVVVPTPTTVTIIKVNGSVERFARKVLDYSNPCSVGKILGNDRTCGHCMLERKNTPAQTGEQRNHNEQVPDSKLHYFTLATSRVEAAQRQSEPTFMGDPFNDLLRLFTANTRFQFFCPPDRSRTLIDFDPTKASPACSFPASESRPRHLICLHQTRSSARDPRWWFSSRFKSKRPKTSRGWPAVCIKVL